MVKCDIRFDQNAYGIYFSGQIVNGKVDIILDKIKSVRGIALKISGFSETTWTETNHNDNRHHHETDKEKRKHKSTYKGREDYLSSTTYLLGSDVGNPIELNPGIYTYSFSCALPDYAPSSFESKIGHIRYVAKVILDRPWKDDQTYSVGFTVLKALDLNNDASLYRIPIQTETRKEFWCGWCSSKPLFLLLELQQTGFVPGESIPVKICLNNGSNINVKNVIISLRKKIEYKSQTPQSIVKHETTTLVKKYCGFVDKKSLKRFEEEIVIPATPPSTRYGCKIIQISYDIKVEAKITGGHSKPSVEADITIGTVPLANVLQETVSNSSEYPHPRVPEFEPNRRNSNINLPILNPISDTLESGTSNNEDIALPTYEEAMDMTRARIDDGERYPIEKREFVPRYPVYNFRQAPTAPEIPSVHCLPEVRRTSIISTIRT